LLLGSVLRGMGFRVVEAKDVASARQQLDSGEVFSLVLLDLFLPGEDGRDLLRSIRHSLATQSLPIIIVTGSEEPRHEFELLDAGADDYLRKPLVIEQLQARVRAVLRRSGVRLVGSGLNDLSSSLGLQRLGGMDAAGAHARERASEQRGRDERAERGADHQRISGRHIEE
jgi:DNA-binding response OmpR family regulator